MKSSSRFLLTTALFSSTLALAASGADRAKSPSAPPPTPVGVMQSAPAGASTGFIDAGTLPFTELLSAPPAAGSIAAAVDLETVLQVQGWRSPEQVTWAKVVERDDVFLHAEILGPWFTRAGLPATDAFFKTLGEDLRAIDRAAKLPFPRPRPPSVDARVAPCVTTPTSTSYPSGAAIQAFVWAELLAEMVPAKRDALLARAGRSAWGRVLGGVHFPSDIMAGRALVPAFLAECRKSDRFRAAFEAAQREVQAAATK